MNHPSIETIKKRMIAKGAVFPMSTRDARLFRGIGPLSIEILRQNGLLVPEFLDGLSPRAVNCLTNMNIFSKEEAREAIALNRIHPGTPRNFGKKTCLEVINWAWVSPPS